jgi:hypothetical protein
MLTLLALLGLGGLAIADSAGSAPPPSTTGAKLGAWFDRGVARLTDTVEQGASDLWAATKAAYDAGARTLRERDAAHAPAHDSSLAGK